MTDASAIFDPSSRRVDFVVVGAGPAGLGVAYRLAGAGRSVLVVERESVVGGLAGSFDVSGQRVDHGSHRLHPTADPTILADLRGLIGTDIALRRRHGRIRMAGAFLPFPPSPVAMVRSLPRRVAARFVRDLVTRPLRRAPSHTFADAIRARLGSELLDSFYAPYVEKLFGLPADLLDAELARRRVGAAGPLDLVVKMLRRDERRKSFWYPRRGYGQLSEALATAAEERGAVIRTGVTVEAIDVDHDGAVVRTDTQDVVASTVLSTVPLPVLARLADGPNIKLATRAMVLIYLVLDRPQWTEYDAHYFPEPAIPIVRISEPRNYRDSVDEPSGRTVLCAEWPCAVGDEIWNAEPDDLAASIRAALLDAELAIPEPLHVETRRVPNAYPVYDLGFAERFERLDTWAGTLEPTLVSFGRQGLYAHDNTHHALAMAWALADCFGPDGKLDVARWRSARVRFGDHVVED